LRAVVQRVSRAAVRVGDEAAGEIQRGLCVLLSVDPGDDERVAGHLAGRIAGLRIFPDPAGRMNLDLPSVGGEVLVVSQFTLHADASRGHRPSFIAAGEAALAERLCDRSARRSAAGASGWPRGASAPTCRWSW